MRSSGVKRLILGSNSGSSKNLNLLEGTFYNIANLVAVLGSILSPWIHRRFKQAEPEVD